MNSKCIKYYHSQMGIGYNSSPLKTEGLQYHMRVWGLLTKQSQATEKLNLYFCTYSTGRICDTT